MCWHCKQLTESFPNYKMDIYCLVTVYMYILNIKLNTTSCLRANFYFVYFPPLPHSRLSGGILRIDFKWYHVVPQTPPNKPKKIIATWRVKRGAKIQLFSTTKWRKYAKKQQNVSFSSLFGLEQVSAVIGSLLPTSMFSLYLS